MQFDGFNGVKGFEERLEPEQIKFAAGSVISGKLESIVAMTVKDKNTGAHKPATKYILEVGRVDVSDGGDVKGFIRDGRRVQFIGTHQVNTKLKPDDEGHFVMVACVGEDTTVRKGDNCMKVFDVRVWPGRFHWGAVNGNGATAGGAPEITDEDIPF